VLVAVCEADGSVVLKPEDAAIPKLKGPGRVDLGAPTDVRKVDVSHTQAACNSNGVRRVPMAPGPVGEDDVTSPG
jgi:hypothetical protein